MKIHLIESVQGDLYGWEGDLISPEEYFAQLVPSLEVELKHSPKEVHINKTKDFILIDNSVYPVGYEVTKQDAMKHGWHATVEWDDDRHQSIHLRTYLNGELHKTIPIYVSGYRSSAAADKVAHYLR